MMALFWSTGYPGLDMLKYKKCLQLETKAQKKAR